MNIGYLYYDNNNQKEITEKIGDFSRMFLNSNGVKPNKCHVNEKQYAEFKKILDEMEIDVIGDIDIMKDYFWLGVEGADFAFYSKIKSDKKENEIREEKLYA